MLTVSSGEFDHSKADRPAEIKEEVEFDSDACAGPEGCGSEIAVWR